MSEVLSDDWEPCFATMGVSGHPPGGTRSDFIPGSNSFCGDLRAFNVEGQGGYDIFGMNTTMWASELSELSEVLIDDWEPCLGCQG